MTDAKPPIVEFQIEPGIIVWVEYIQARAAYEVNITLDRGSYHTAAAVTLNESCVEQLAGWIKNIVRRMLDEERAHWQPQIGYAIERNVDQYLRGEQN